jgi:Lon-like protease
VRKLWFLASLVVLVLAAASVRIPVTALVPAPVISLGENMEVPGAPGELSGDLGLTLVELRDLTITETVKAWLDPDRELLFDPAVVPTGVEETDFVDVQRRLFEESVVVASAAGMAAAGLEVSIGGSGAQVVEVLAGGPADGELREGDVILAIDDVEVALAPDLLAVTTRRQAGDAVTVTFRRGDETRTAEVRLAAIGHLDRPALGVLVRTLDLEVEAPFSVELELPGVVGPSGGLMLALTVFDLVSEDVDLTAGRFIAGTGTVDARGAVGSVGGVRHKVRAAVDAGADLFLVGESDADEAREVADGELEVVGVSTLDEAIETLLGTRGNAGASAEGAAGGGRGTHDRERDGGIDVGGGAGIIEASG